MQSTDRIHPDRYNATTENAKNYRLFIAALRTLKRRSPERARAAVKTMMPWLMVEDYAQPLETVKHELEAVDAIDKLADEHRPETMAAITYFEGVMK